jgi:Domain of unknown function (DUF4178)
MITINCPSCGAPVAFNAASSVYAVCKFCNSMLVRKDIEVSSIGKMAQLPQDFSPFQIGTEGRWNSVSFGIVGRMRQSWSDGFWNEWFLILGDGSKGWLVEAEGRYAVCREVPDFDSDEILHADSDASVLRDKAFIFEGLRLQVSDFKEARCIASEGELPFVASQGRTSVSYDFTGQGGEFASIEICDGARRAFFGQYRDWSELQCKNFKTLEGW